jgi:hypothetical protein
MVCILVTAVDLGLWALVSSARAGAARKRLAEMAIMHAAVLCPPLMCALWGKFRDGERFVLVKIPLRVEIIRA